eukprot:evm.model.NODE_16121_length_1092_cov_21.043041.1
MLFDELQDITQAVKDEGGREGRKEDEVEEMLSEVLTLLLYVCHTPACRNTLAKPSWIALLFLLIKLTGPRHPLAQQRGLCLLRSLLPFCPPSSLPSSSSTDPLAMAKALLFFLLDLLSAPYGSSSSSSSDACSSFPPYSSSPIRAPGVIPLAPLASSQEALSLLLTLLLVPSSLPSSSSSSIPSWSFLTGLAMNEALDGLGRARGLLRRDGGRARGRKEGRKNIQASPSFSSKKEGGKEEVEEERLTRKDLRRALQESAAAAESSLPSSRLASSAPVLAEEKEEGTASTHPSLILSLRRGLAALIVLA